MPRRILVDATHLEETRVVVLENGRVTEYDSETSIKKQLKGNIYLAKVTRVEPSLQAAFVEYGGDKHGFLPFSEIHPDYYDIPVADKQELLKSIRSSSDEQNEDGDHLGDDDTVKISDSPDEDLSADADIDETDIIEDETDIADNLSEREQNLYKKYKIQEVIKRNRVIPVQVEKEERGNKCASLTTYISLAGKYCVLMPNSLRKGGVSRRIENREDRKRLKLILNGLNIPEEKGLIIRTAGAKKTAQELESDYNYLANLWNKIREGILAGTAPEFIHAEGDIIKRTMRDLFNETVDEVLIEGDDAYSHAKDFMKIMLSLQVSRVKQYKNKVPIFTRYKVEEQIAALYRQEVPLESGGALVINPTEALISIDVNSGKSTGQKTIEETAVTTNIEAAREVARQLKLRDLSGLIVIDFIDMMSLKNKKTVERVLRESLADDRARIQVGRISTFGLLEMSRQRMSASFLEVNTMVCPHCEGSGVIKATESIAITVLRAIENDVSRSNCKTIRVYVSQDVAIYILNNKRTQLGKIENKYNIRVFLNVDGSVGADGFYLERMKDYETADSAVAVTARNKKPERNITDLNSSEIDKEHESDEVVTRRTRKSKVKEVVEDSNNKEISLDNIFEGLWRKIVE